MENDSELKINNTSPEEINDYILNIINDDATNENELLNKIKEYLILKVPDIKEKLEQFGIQKESSDNIVISNTPNLDIKQIDTKNNTDNSIEKEDNKKILTAFKKEDLNQKEEKKDDGSTWANYKQKEAKNDNKVNNNENYNIDNNNFLGKKRYKSTEKEGKEDSKDKQNEDKTDKTDNIYKYSLLKEMISKYGYRNILKNIYQKDSDNKDETSKIEDSDFNKLIETEGKEKLTYMLINMHNSNKAINVEPHFEGGFYTDPKRGIKISTSQVIISKKPSPKKNDVDDTKSIDSTMSRGSSRYRKELGLGLHLHKDENNNIYKYCLHHFLGETIAIFYCSDKECKSVANYDVDSKTFTVTVDHSKTHEQHNYIMNFESEKRDKLIVLEFQKKTFKEGQVFRKGEGKRIVQWYTC